MERHNNLKIYNVKFYIKKDLKSMLKYKNIDKIICAELRV